MRLLTLILPALLVATTVEAKTSFTKTSKPSVSKTATRSTATRSSSAVPLGAALVTGTAIGAIAAQPSYAATSSCGHAVATPENAKAFGQLTCTSDGSNCLEGLFTKKVTPFNDYAKTKLKKPDAQVYSLCFDQKKRQATLHWKE